jgi:hypothetical protein
MSTSKQSLLIPRVTVPVAVTMIVIGGLLVMCAANTAMSYLRAPKLELPVHNTFSTVYVDTGSPFAMTLLFASGWLGVWMILAGIYGSRKLSLVAMIEDTTESND